MFVAPVGRQRRNIISNYSIEKDHLMLAIDAFGKCFAFANVITVSGKRQQEWRLFGHCNGWFLVANMGTGSVKAEFEHRIAATRRCTVG